MGKRRPGQSGGSEEADDGGDIDCFGGGSLARKSVGIKESEFIDKMQMEKPGLQDYCQLLCA